MAQHLGLVDDEGVVVEVIHGQHVQHLGLALAHEGSVLVADQPGGESGFHLLFGMQGLGRDLALGVCLADRAIQGLGAFLRGQQGIVARQRIVLRAVVGVPGIADELVAQALSRETDWAMARDRSSCGRDQRRPSGMMIRRSVRPRARLGRFSNSSTKACSARPSSRRAA